MPQNLADGQLASSAAAIYSGGSLRDGIRVNVVLNNVGSSDEVVILTIARSAGTQRRIMRVELAMNYQFHLTGLAIDPTDILYGVTTSDATVDYIISTAGPSDAFNSAVFDETGNSAITGVVANTIGDD
jgi:hypothetical protein